MYLDAPFIPISSASNPDHPRALTTSEANPQLTDGGSRSTGLYRFTCTSHADRLSWLTRHGRGSGHDTEDAAGRRVRSLCTKHPALGSVDPFALPGTWYIARGPGGCGLQLAGDALERSPMAFLVGRCLVKECSAVLPA